VRQDRPQRDDVEPAGGDLRYIFGRAEPRGEAAPPRLLHGVRREVDAGGVKPTLARNLEEKADAAAIVEQATS